MSQERGVAQPVSPRYQPRMPLETSPQTWPPGCVSVSNGCGIHSACHSLAKIGPSRKGTSSPLGSQSLVLETNGTGL